MNPWLNTSSRSPRMRTISSPRNVISSPQVASQKGHVRNAVRVGDSVMPPACPIRSPCCQDRCAMRRLHPDPRDPVDVAESYDDSTRAPHDGRPWLYLCMIASADGATAVDGRSGTLGGPGDRAVFNALRGHADLVLVGAGTVARGALRPTQARRPPASRSSHARSTSTGSPTSCAVAKRSSSPPSARATCRRASM